MRKFVRAIPRVYPSRLVSVVVQATASPQPSIATLLVPPLYPICLFVIQAYVFFTARVRPIAQVTYYELKSGLTRCSAGSVSPTNFAPSCTLCPLGTYSTSFSQTQCIPCPTGQITPMPGATSKALCAALSCPYVSVGPDPLGALALFALNNLIES